MANDKINPKDQAISLINHYKKVVYPYVGSDFMTGTENETLKFNSAKKEAKYLIQHMLTVTFPYTGDSTTKTQFSHITYWNKVNEELDVLSIDDPLINTNEQSTNN